MAEACAKGHVIAEVGTGSHGCKKCWSEYIRAWYHAKPGRVEARREKTRRYRERNPEKYASTIRRWREVNQVKVREYSRKYSSARRAPGGSPVELEHLRLLFDAQDGRCRYCGNPLDATRELEHRIPLSRGGLHEPSNLCWSCRGCNRKKMKKTEVEFLA